MVWEWIFWPKDKVRDNLTAFVAGGSKYDGPTVKAECGLNSRLGTWMREMKLMYLCLIQY